ncbi:MAG TPA: TonB-dependent receptor plug domain-containing protein, partial [Opitutus sp.]|nr:TonB-dependent receptor plug domain-containing protein [Opitutus sp.]
MTPTLPCLPRRLPTFRKSAGFSLAVSILLFAGASGVYAQDSAASAAIDDKVIQLDTFEVTGLRSSAIKALEIKRNSPQIMESIVAEDIGKFPDNNAVESLQRLPGVQVTDYGAGNIASVTIRGLPDVTTTLHGRNIFTA